MFIEKINTFFGGKFTRKWSSA